MQLYLTVISDLQEEFSEELEPLFDYRRVQPLNVVYLDGELFWTLFG